MYKIDPHRHLGGSISPECVWQMIQMRGYNYLASSFDDVQRAMTFQQDEPKTFHRFLDKFVILDEIIWDEELIDISIKNICKSLELENIDYCWLDFSINKYMHLKWHKREAIKFIYESFQTHRPNKVGLILSLKYESLRETQRQYAKLIDEVGDMLLGLDLVGDEAYFDYNFYSPIFKHWKSANKMVRAHVGESQSAENVENAIIKMNATNVAHGIKCANDKRILQLALDNDVSFDLAITSNYVTGVLQDSEIHPVISMLDNHVNVTIGSDDPIQFGVSLDDEYNVFKSMAEKCGKTQTQIEDMIQRLYKNAMKNTLKFVEF